jgi:hypothetical protein
MALTDENGFVTTMPVAPAYGGGNGGFGNFGGDWGWIILLLLCAGGGWGNGFGGGYGNMMLGYDFPWLMNGQQGINNNVSDGFRDAQLNDNITSVRDGISALSTQLCGCCGDMQMAMANGFAGVEQGANARQMANMQTAFDLQNAVSTGFNNVGLQLCQASGENRLATANLGADIAREACATRTSDTQNTQLILNAINDGFRQMNEYRFQDKIDAKNDEIAQLRQENLYARGQASQIAQNSAIINGVYDRLNQCPVGTVPVYGEQPIFTCPNNNSGCGCGCGM